METFRTTNIFVNTNVNTWNYIEIHLFITFVTSGHRSEPHKNHIYITFLFICFHIILLFSHIPRLAALFIQQSLKGFAQLACLQTGPAEAVAATPQPLCSSSTIPRLVWETKTLAVGKSQQSQNNT